MQRYLSLYFNPTGRVSRGAYWLNAVIILPIATLLINLLSGLLTDTLLIVTLIAYIAMLWSSLALSIKRLHDRDMSAWYLLLGLIPFVGGIVLFIILAFLQGTKGPNRYGPQPHWFN